MGVLLCCDALCGRTINPDVHLGKPAAPNGWLMLGTTDGRFVVSCPDCVDKVMALGSRKPS